MCVCVTIIIIYCTFTALCCCVYMVHIYACAQDPHICMRHAHVIFSIVRDVMGESIFLFVPNIIGTCMTDATL